MKKFLCLFVVLSAELLAQGLVPPPGKWTTPQAFGFPAENVGYAGLVCAPADSFGTGTTGRCLLLGKYFEYSSEPNYCVVGWSWKENRWDVMDCSPSYNSLHLCEGGHTDGAWSYIPAGVGTYGNGIIAFCGQSGSNMPEIIHHTLYWDIGARVGRIWTGWGLGATGIQPGETKNLSSTYDTFNNKMVYFPAVSQANDLLTENPATHVKVNPAVTGSAPPGSYTFQPITYNSVNHKVYMTAGWTKYGANGCLADGVNAIMTNDVWSLDTATNVWELLAKGSGILPDPATGRYPAPRGYAGFAFNPDDNVAMLTGGEWYDSTKAGTSQACSNFNDAWLLDFNPATPTWRLLHDNSPLGAFTSVQGTVSGFKYAVSNNYFAGTVGPDAPFWQMDYIPGSHTFVFVKQTPTQNGNEQATVGFGPYVGGSHTNYASRVWLYCLEAPYNASGVCPAIGDTTKTYPLPTASANRLQQGVPAATEALQTWANQPGIASNGSSILGVWIESPKPWTPPSCGPGWMHPVGQTTSDNVSWTKLSADNCLGMDHARSATVNRDAFLASAAYVNGIPWSCFAVSPNVSAPPNGVQCVQWDGTAWVGGFLSSFGDPTTAASRWNGPNRIIAVGNTPTVGLLQIDKSVQPFPARVLVAQFDGSTWSQLGASLYVASPNAPTCANCMTAETMDVASDGTNPVVAWSAYFRGASVAQNFTQGWGLIPTPGWVYAAKWNGSAWVNFATGLPWTSADTPLNVSLTSWATGVSITAVSPTDVYLSWTEHTITGNAILYVKRWNGTSWSLISSGLNHDMTNGYAYKTRTINDGTNVYVGWDENNHGVNNKVYVAMWNHTSWTALGGALNADQANGTAKNLDLAMLNGRPVGGWEEVQLGSLMQIYLKQWNGSGWVSSFGGNSPSVQLTASSLSFGTVTVGASSSNQSIGVTNAGTADLILGTLSLTGSDAASFVKTADGCSGNTITAGNNCNVTLHFTPAGAGSLSASLSIPSNAFGSPNTVTLNGTGLAPGAPAVTLAPSTITFPSQTVNTSSAPQTILLTNSGTAALVVSNVAITGANAADFSATNVCVGTVAIGASCSINVTIRPISLGARTASVSVSSNASGSPHVVTLTGTGTSTTPVAGLASLTTVEALPGCINCGKVRVNEPVTVGLPLVDSTDTLSVANLGCAGSAACQFRILSRWDSGNAKWVLFDYLAGMAADSSSTSVQLTTGTGNVGANLASDAGATISVNTGAGGCAFVIQKANYDLFHSVVCNGKTLASGGSDGVVLMGPVYPATACIFQSTCTAKFASALDNLSTCVIEENGPVRVAVKCTGSLKDASLNRYMGFGVRMHFYRGTGRVKTVVSYRNADDGAQGSFAVTYKPAQSMYLSQATQLSGTNTWMIPNDSGTSTGALTTGQNVYAYQGQGKTSFDPDYNGSLQFQTAALANAAMDVTRGTFTTTGSASSGSFTVTVADPTKVAVGQYVSGGTLLTQTYVTAVNGSVLTVNQKTASAMNNATLTFLTYAQLGYLVVDPAGAIAASGLSAPGWAEIMDASGGHGITVGLPDMSANFPRSLELRNGGREVRVGIAPDQTLWPDANCDVTPTPCKKVYYQPWPEYRMGEVEWIFHDTDTNGYGETGATRSANDFFRMQYPLIARAPVTHYNNTGAMPYKLVDKVAADNYFQSVAARYGKSFAAMTDLVPVWTRGWDFACGGSECQHDIRFDDGVTRWIERGFTGRYLQSLWFQRYQETIVWPRTDNLTCVVNGVPYHGWVCHNGNLSVFNADPSACSIKNANMCTTTSALMPNNCVITTGCAGGYVMPLASENSGSRHYHWWSMIYMYLLTGDEDIRDVVQDAINEHAAIGTTGNWTTVTGNGNLTVTPQFNKSWQASGLNNRMLNSGSFGGRLIGSAHLWRFLTDTGQTQDAGFVDTMIRNQLDVMYREPCATSGLAATAWPCFPVFDGSQTSQETRGFSAYRGIFIGALDYANAARCAPAAGQTIKTTDNFARCVEPFMQGYLSVAILTLVNLRGPGWSEYQKLFDLGYGAALNVDQSNYISGLATGTLPSQDQLVYTMAIDQPNSLAYIPGNQTLPDNNGPGPPMSGLYWLWGAYTGETAPWKSHWEGSFINRASGTTYSPNKLDEYGSYLTDPVVDMILNPPAAHLVTVCQGAWTQPGCSKSFSAGTWTFGWAAPTGVSKYYFKEHDTLTIVPNIGWDHQTNLPISPTAATDYNWFAIGNNVLASPAVGATSATATAPSGASFMLMAQVGGTIEGPPPPPGASRGSTAANATLKDSKAH